jgi:hypothetical protein
MPVILYHYRIIIDLHYTLRETLHLRVTGGGGGSMRQAQFQAPEAEASSHQHEINVYYS